MVDFINLLEQVGGKFRKAGKGYLGHALHRPDKNPSLSVFPAPDGGVIVKDHATGESWSGYRYLKDALGREDLAQRWLEMTRPWDPTRTEARSRPKDAPRLPKVSVAYMEVQPATDEWEAEAKAAMEEALEAVLNGEHPETLRYMEKRGLKPEQAYAAGLGAVDRGIAIPVYDEEVRIKGIKVRRWDEGRGRFVSLFPGRGNGYYFSPDFAWKPMTRVVLVEGELNAAAVYLALDVPTIGIPGASTGLSVKMVEKLKEHAAEVVILTDQDEAGRSLAERLITQLVQGGYDMKRIYIPAEDRYHRDPMDVLKDSGLDGLTRHLSERIYNRGSRLKVARGTKTSLAKVVSVRTSGVNTKRALQNASGVAMVRRHARYVDPERLEAHASLEDYLTEQAFRRGVKPQAARKAVRMWMLQHRITPAAALFLVYELNGISTSRSDIKDRVGNARRNHPLFSRYCIYVSRAKRFDVARLVEDAIAEILEMVREVESFFAKVAERVRREREAFARWISAFPHLLKHIVRRALPPPALAKAA